MAGLEVPVFHPTWKNVQGGWEEYVEGIEKRAGKVGIAKIVPPKGWTPRKDGYPDDLDWVIPRPVRQVMDGNLGLWKATQLEARSMRLADGFRPIALQDVYKPGRNADSSLESQEKNYWKTVFLKPQLYGADVPGSLFDKDLKGWNLNDLDSLLSRKLKEKDCEIPGVSTPYLYFGTWRSTFPWHTEDMDLASVNYLHFGAPKMWYCVPPSHRRQFEALVKDLYPDAFRVCPQFLRHKEMVISPALLEKARIPVVKTVQQPGEFIISAPGAYHSGFNFGYNCAESTNFATRAWIGLGVEARCCECRSDSVRIQMDLFLDEAPARLKKAIRDAMPESESESESESEDSDSDAASSCDEASSVGSDSECGEPAPRRRAAAKTTSGAAGRRKPGVKAPGAQAAGRGRRQDASKGKEPPGQQAGGRGEGAEGAKGRTRAAGPPKVVPTAPAPKPKPAPKAIAPAPPPKRRLPLVVTTSSSRRAGVPGSRTRTLAAMQARLAAGISWEKPKGRYTRSAGGTTKPIRRPAQAPMLASPEPKKAAAAKTPAMPRLPSRGVAAKNEPMVAMAPAKDAVPQPATPPVTPRTSIITTRRSAAGVASPSPASTSAGAKRPASPSCVPVPVKRARGAGVEPPAAKPRGEGKGEGNGAPVAGKLKGEGRGVAVSPPTPVEGGAVRPGILTRPGRERRPTAKAAAALSEQLLGALKVATGMVLGSRADLHKGAPVARSAAGQKKHK